MDEALYSLLRAFTGPQEGAGPPTVHLVVTSSDEVIRLRQQVIALEKRIDQMDADFKRVEYLYRCETLINTRITDYCREKGFKLPPRLLKNI